MSRILITGATGFVGRGVVRALRAAGHTLSGTTRRVDIAQGPDGVPLYRVGDFAEATDLSRVVAGADIIVHLAARAHETAEQGTGVLELYRAVNRDGSRRLAEAAAAAGVRRLVFMSSIKAMAEESDRPLNESDTPQPEDAYGISKWEAEQDLADVAARTGIELVILRPPLVYGPNVRGNLLSLMRAIDRGWPLPLGGIDNRRSIISVANLASAVALVATHSEASGSTFVVADDADVSTPELVRGIGEALGRRARLVTLPPAVLAIARRLPAIGIKIRRLTGSLQLDSRLIRDRLGWAPPHSRAQATADMVAAYRAGR